MNYTALAALEEQAELTREYGNYAKGKPSSIIGSFPRESADRLALVCRASDPVYIDPQIEKLLEDAMPTLPDSIPLRAEDVPLECGFLKFGKPIRTPAHTSAIAGAEDLITHIAWINFGEGVEIYRFGRSVRHGQEGLLQFISASHWIFGEPLDNDDYIEELGKKYEGRPIEQTTYFGRNQQEKNTVTAENLIIGVYLDQLDTHRWMYAVWHFMTQKVSARERQYPDRAMRKRLELEKEQKFVDIITLRASEKRKEQEFEEATRHISVRFWVRAHWRKQWYPSEGVNKPVWISSYVKGPEGAKFVGATKLFSVSR